MPWAFGNLHDSILAVGVNANEQHMPNPSSNYTMSTKKQSSPLGHTGSLEPPSSNDEDMKPAAKEPQQSNSRLSTPKVKFNVPKLEPTPSALTDPSTKSAECGKAKPLRTHDVSKDSKGRIH